MKAHSVEQIQQAEVSLGLQFADDYREYITKFGVVSYEGHELTGTCASPRSSVVNVMQREREKTMAIPTDWYVIELANIDDIVIRKDTSGTVYQTMPRAAPQRICGLLSEYVMM